MAVALTGSRWFSSTTKYAREFIFLGANQGAIKPGQLS
jgi:hypothetical protein